LSTITERVERGAALLDEKRPGWWRLIDLGRLDIDSDRNCVIRQLGSYVGTVRGLGLYYSAADVAHGFQGDDDDETAALTVAWRDLIGQRLAQAVPA